MTNAELVTNWKSLGIQQGTEFIKLKDCFKICWSEGVDEYQFTDGGKSKIVTLDMGGAMENPSLWCHSDDDDNCWEMYITKDSEKPSRRKIGKFVKL